MRNWFAVVLASYPLQPELGEGDRNNLVPFSKSPVGEGDLGDEAIATMQAKQNWKEITISNDLTPVRAGPTLSSRSPERVIATIWSTAASADSRRYQRRSRVRG